MRIFPIVALIAGVLASTAAVSATEGAQRQNPYATLFTGQLNGAPTPQTPPAPAPQFIPLPPLPRSYPSPAQTVVCGLTVVQGDSKIDSKLPHHPPANAPKPSIRIVPAPACQK
jgi:hypothetical protein